MNREELPRRNDALVACGSFAGLLLLGALLSATVVWWGSLVCSTAAIIVFLTLYARSERRIARARAARLRSIDPSYDA